MACLAKDYQGLCTTFEPGQIPERLFRSQIKPPNSRILSNQGTTFKSNNIHILVKFFKIKSFDKLLSLQ
jgi:hypothetical protein